MVWGQPRMSADVDVTVELEAPDAADFVNAIKKAGFQTRVQDVERFVTETKVIPLLHRETKLPLDVVLAGPGLEEQFLERVRWTRVEGLEIPVISPEDLIVTKILAGRAKDLQDVRGVLRRQRDSLDLERVRTTLDLLQQALGQSDLLPILEAEMEAVRGESK